MLSAMSSRSTHGTENSPTAEQLQILQTASEFAYRIWENRTGSCQTFLRSYPLDQTLTRQQIDDLIQDYTLDDNYQLADEPQVMSGLRNLRTLLMMRWIWQDALQAITLDQLTDELSEFADGCISFAKEYTYKGLIRQYGEPTFIDSKGNVQIDDMAIMAMGKLGAHELNLSSDIDLIFIHKKRGETNGNKANGTRSIDNKRFMTRLGQGIIKLLDQNTADGFVFRVDMRLRPWGDGSDLAIHLSALQKYFSLHGRAWERFAWLKANIIGQVDQDFYNDIESLIKPFVFRYYVDYSAFSALREMKSLIQNQVAQREDLDNIKLGAGGIRDIEFIVQAFQLIYGGRHTQLQVKSCLKAMQVLHEFNYLESTTYNQLQAAYRFLRRLEHGIQGINDQQTQRLPHDPQWQHNLAITLGFDDWSALLTTLNQHRENVNIPFERMVIDRQVANDENIEVDAKSIDEQVEQLNEVLTEENRHRLRSFWQSKLVKNLSDEARGRLDDAYPVVVHALLAHEDKQLANSALPRLIDLLEAICRRSIYLVMIAENPNATTELIPMLSASPWIAKELAQYPVLLDTFLQQRYRHLPDKDELSDILRQQLLRVEPGDEEKLLSVLRLFKKNQILAVAAGDILAERPIMEVSDSLSYIAAVVLEAALDRAFAEIVSRYGYPIGQDGDPVTEADCGFAIIGYGKLGGLELSYASDLDLVFLHRIKEGGMTTGEKSVSGMKFAARLVQKLMNYLNTQTRDGRVYEIDMRLRPSGNAGMMVVSYHAFETYQLEKAWSWEHQALVRARAVCGDRRVTARFCNIRRDVLVLPRTIDQVRNEVTSMRIKMQKHLGTSQWQQQKAGKFHLKQDTGGIIDIEFLAQFAVLAYSNEHPSLANWSDNVRIFEEVASLGIWEKQVCQDLSDAYLRIRTATHKLALSEQSLLVDDTLWKETRALVQAQWQHLMGVGSDEK
ncbi:MAG: bifunctional [glutamate--ammonia ligase]-adenylyl-L-tyrosine phosphorylase/[glutamate--ammonia-ligase] adenylyltransferase [Moraxellaceae bacterium]|uniref:bifunctional [glutamate--ammonia ligase]-adenylyl-L-tyrosine phosphorylase/[glutamate--ammonia-ligase] adenylyltransferase n=1 Tax=Psychrobacter sp. TaxID=56811 RepID=UPI003F94EBF3